VGLCCAFLRRFMLRIHIANLCREFMQCALRNIGVGGLDGKT